MKRLSILKLNIARTWQHEKYFRTSFPVRFLVIKPAYINTA